MILNHVMSADMASGIFKDLINYSQKYSKSNWNINVSNKPKSESSVYHYHRPHLENQLMNNSVVTVHHDLLDDDKWHLFENFEKQYRQASKIICLNTNQIDFLKDNNINNTVLIPHGYNDSIFKGTLKEVSNKINLGIISKRYGRKVKGEALLYDLMKRLDTERIEFTFVGKDRTQDCWKARNLGFSAKVYERLPYKVFGSLYQSLDALMITSLYEGGPANVPEAIASATPLIATNVGMVSDYLVNNNGFFLTGNPDIDAENINKYAIDKKFQRNIKINAYESRGIALSWKSVTELQFDLYEEVAK